MTDRFWMWFGKALAVACTAFTFACACGFVYVLYEDYRDSQTRPVFTITPDSTHTHPKKAP